MLDPGHLILQTASELADLEDGLHKAARNRVSAYSDPHDFSLASGIPPEPPGLSRMTLQRIAASPLVSAILMVQLRQFVHYLAPQENRFVPGFRVKLRESRRSPTRVELRESDRLTRFLVQAGEITDPREYTTVPSLKRIGVMMMRDSLRYDLAPAEIRRNEKGLPARITPVDGRTMYVDPAVFASPRGLRDGDFTTPRYCQVVNGEVVARFRPTEMLWGIRNHTTDIDRRGYGYPELELARAVFTAYSLAWRRNAKYFTQGFTGAGFINVATANGEPYPPAALDIFKEDVRAQLAGDEGHHRVGVISGATAQWVKVGSDAKDMEWAEWSRAQVRTLCAIMGMSPDEINEVYGNAGQSSSLGGQTDPVERVRESKARGLHTKVWDFWGWFDDHVIKQLNPDFVVEPTGAGERSEQEQLDLDKMRGEFITGNERRAAYDLPAIDEGDYILTPVGLQAAQLASAKTEGDDEPAVSLDIASLFEDPEPDDDGAAAVDAGEPDAEPDLRLSRRIFEI